MQDKSQQDTSHQEGTSVSTPALEVSNPLQAASEIFYKPKAVFDAIAVKDNWSWIPFLLVVISAAIPAYLYFNLVDFDWYANMIALSQNPEGSPAELEAFANYMELGSTQLITVVSVAIGLPIMMAILAGYFTIVTRNDEKSVQGFTDWYGATWWMSMPSILNALVACLLLVMQTAGSEITTSILAPLSLGFALGMEITDPAANLLNSIGIHNIWAIFLSYVCIRSWTNFTQLKSSIVALIPSLVMWGISLLFVL